MTQDEQKAVYDTVIYLVNYFRTSDTSPEVALTAMSVIISHLGVQLDWTNRDAAHFLDMLAGLIMAEKLKADLQAKKRPY